MGDWTVVTRDDGSKMWAYKGRPLYTFVRDKAAGDMTGDGVGQGARKVAQPWRARTPPVDHRSRSTARSAPGTALHEPTGRLVLMAPGPTRRDDLRPARESVAAVLPQAAG